MIIYNGTHVYRGRNVKFYHPDNETEDKLENGIMHEWFLVEGEKLVFPYAVIEREDGRIVFVNYHDVVFEKPGMAGGKTK